MIEFYSDNRWESCQVLGSASEKYRTILKRKWKLANKIGPSVFANWCLSSGSWAAIFTWTLENKGAIFLHDYFSKGCLLGPWEGTSWFVKLARAWANAYISKRHRQNLPLFSKVNSLRKGMSGAFGQEEIWLV